MGKLNNTFYGLILSAKIQILIVFLIISPCIIRGQGDIDRIIKLNKTADSLTHINPVEARKTAESGLELALKIKHDSLQYACRFTKGISNYFLGNLNEALADFIQNKGLAQKINSPLKLIESLNAIGNVYKDIDRYDAALQSYKEALNVCNSTSNSGKTYLVLSNIASVLNFLHQNDSSNYYCYKILRAMQLAKKTNEAFSAGIYGNILSNYIEKKNKDSIVKYSKLVLDFQANSGDKLSYAGNLYNLGSFYFNIGEYKTAEKYLSTALAAEPENIEVLIDITWVLGKTYSKLNSLDKATEMYNDCIFLKDSLYKIQTVDKLSEMEVKYETGKKEEELKRLAITSEMDALKLKNSKAWLIVSVGGIMLCLFGAALLFRQFKSKQKANKLLESQNHEILEQKKEITDSINYAKRIQTAILPPKRYVDSLLKQNFIFYAPKDIVSGDFYWVDSRDNKVLFAAVDCTGHGVPGALMSVVGYNLLSQAVKEKGLTSPSKILSYLDEGVHQTLRQSQNESGIKDGMDLAICCIHPDNILEYAGVYNSVCIVRKNIAETFAATSQRMAFYGKDLLEIKSDKLQIGSNENDVADEYTNHQIQLQAGDCVYLYSDGFADQFGGPKGKKFKYNKLKDELISMHTLSPEEQRDRLSSAFTKWKGTLEQVDDILVIGVKI